MATAMEKGILGAKTIKQASRLMKANVFTCPELINATFDNIEAGKQLNGYVNLRNKDEALREAHESQIRIERSKYFPPCQLTH
jgi:Asp-tRNA(Asn)/Glu-tRNA(Gln) amidotransferase A subunit family amidase